MSGSPIIQDGKLVDAVTHVLVNDPTKGYGIFIENMLNAAEWATAAENFLCCFLRLYDIILLEKSEFI